MANEREMRVLVRELERQGWTTRKAKSGHFIVTHPQGKRVTMSATPRNRRGILNAKADLRRVDPTVIL